MACFVTGIAPTSDVSELESLLGGVPNIDRTKLSVITKEEQSDKHDSSFLNFIHAGDPTIDGGTFGSLDRNAIMTGSGGTGVPGIGRGNSPLGLLGSDDVVSAIGTLPIPADEASNYNDALHDGRCVVAYECADGEAAGVEEAMRAAGVRKVKTFR